MFLECFMRYDPCLHQAINHLFRSDIYLSIALLVYPLIFVHDILGNEFERYLVIFVFLHWIFHVDVL